MTSATDRRPPMIWQTEGFDTKDEAQARLADLSAQHAADDHAVFMVTRVTSTVAKGTHKGVSYDRYVVVARWSLRRPSADPQTVADIRPAPAR